MSKQEIPEEVLSTFNEIAAAAGGSKKYALEGITTPIDDLLQQAVFRATQHTLDTETLKKIRDVNNYSYQYQRFSSSG